MLEEGRVDRFWKEVEHRTCCFFMVQYLLGIGMVFSFLDFLISFSLLKYQQPAISLQTMARLLYPPYGILLPLSRYFTRAFFTLIFETY